MLRNQGTRSKSSEIQIESTFIVGGLVSHNDFHDGPPSSNLYDNARDGHNMHYDFHVWTRVRRLGPTTQNLWYVHMAQLCYPVVDFSRWGGRATRWAAMHHNVEQAKILVWTTWHPTVLASPIYLTSGSWWKVGVIVGVDHIGHF